MLTTLKDISGKRERLYQSSNASYELNEEQGQERKNVIQVTNQGKKNVTKGKRTCKVNGKNRLERSDENVQLEPTRSMQSMVRAGPIFKNNQEGGIL